MAGSVHELERLERLRVVLLIQTLRYYCDARARYPRARLLVTIRNEVIALTCVVSFGIPPLGAQHC
jgi:hypothetical protein